MDLSSSSVATPASAALSVKLEVNGEFRRFSLEPATFAALRDAVAAVFGSDPFVIRYKDDDGDDISCTNEQEFATALSLLSADRVFRCSAVSSAKQEKKFAKQEKKRSKRDAKSEKKSRKASNKAAKERKASKVDSSEESSASSLSSEPSESSSSEEDKKKEKHSRKASKREKKAAKKARKHEVKSHKKSHKHDELSASSDDDDDVSASSSSESAESSQDEVEARIARLQAKIAELLHRAGPDALAKYERRVQKKQAKKQAKHEKKLAKKQRKEDTSSSTSSESSSSPSEEQVARQEMKERLRELKRNRKLLMKAARHALKHAQEQAKEAKKKLDREVSLFKEEIRGSKREFDARFVNHVNFPDNADVEPSFGLNKSFKFVNSGSKAWPATVKLLLVSRFDNSLNAPDSVEIGHEVNPGEEVVITVPLRTPAQPGVYDAFFRLALVSGQKFGQRIRCRLHVLPTTSSAPSSSETPAAPAAPVEEEPAPTTLSAPILLAAATEVKDDHSVLA